MMEQVVLAEKSSARRMSAFAVIWVGQVVSLIGSDLTGFALGVWTYRHTGSVTQFSLIVLCAELPGILLSPLVGAIVDRSDRRALMILSNVGAGLSTLTLAVLARQGWLRL